MTELSVEFCSGRYEPASVIGDTQDHERCSGKLLNKTLHSYKELKTSHLKLSEFTKRCRFPEGSNV